MKNDATPTPTGTSLRRRVRSLTVGAVGAAVLATCGITVSMADGQSTQGSAADASTGAATTDDTTGSSTSSSSAESGTSIDSAPLLAPSRAPTVTGNTGNGHAVSGGS